MPLRTFCAICKNEDFEIINEFPNFPIMTLCTNDEINLFYNYCLILCKKCSCLQLRNLIDPSILYSTGYTMATFSPSWLAHNIKFGDFILENTESESFLEIGANKGGLYKILSNKRKLDYTILDMYKDSDLPSDVKFMEGNCETFDFTGIHAVILSHVFEHLYSPSKFIEQLSKSNVKEIFISNPNFDLCLDKQFFNTVWSEHTFYCGFDHMMYIFSMYKYRCYSFFQYDGAVTSQMYKFVYDPSMKPKALPYIDKQLFKNIYVDKVKLIQDLEITEKSVICPSGIYGQKLYYFLKNKENIIGFIDNNPQRQAKKLYGTGQIVYSPKDIDYTKVNVLLCNSTYNDEIIAGLKELCHTVKITIV